MELLNNLIHTVGLNESFFYQFLLVVGLYFVTQKLFLQAYHDNVQKRSELTQGKLTSNQEIENKIKTLQEEYEQKARGLNKKFQHIFHQIKEDAEQKTKEKKKQIEDTYQKNLKLAENQLKKQEQAQSEEIQKEIPSLVEALTEKMRG